MSGDVHARAIASAREGNWQEAARLLGSAGSSSTDPFLVNDLAVIHHQLGRTGEAVRLLQALSPRSTLPAIARLNLLYLEKALELETGFDPAWEHLDHDGMACPARPALVSVIVRTYRRPDLLGEALASLRGQTFTDFEAIVVNDGGGPESEGVARTSGIPGLRYLATPHLGRVQALNTGLEMAHGRYVTGLDDDDALYPDHLQVLVDYLRSPAAAPVVYAGFKVVRYRRQGSGLVPAETKDYRGKSLDPGSLFRTNPASIMLMARRECYERVGRFCPDLALAEDWEMWLRLSRDFAIHGLDRITAEVRERPGELNLTRRGRRRKYYWDNTVLFLHRGLPLLSRARAPGLESGYARAMARLDGLAAERPEALKLINLRGFWTMTKPYAWFADQGRWFLELGEPELAGKFFAAAGSLGPLEPRVWRGWLKSRFAGRGAGPATEAGDDHDLE